LRAKKYEAAGEIRLLLFFGVLFQRQFPAPGVCETGMVSSNLKRMMQLSILIRFRRPRLAGAGRVFRSLPMIFLAACAALSLPPCASAKVAKEFSPATLVETADYQPCRNGCSAKTEPVSAFCFRQGDQVLIADGSSLLHENKFSGMEELAGKQVQIRFNERFVWVMTPDGQAMKLERGTTYENFKDAGCIREVRKPIIDAAYAHKRPGKVSTYAFALAGSGKGDLYLWFQCDLSSDKSVIACQRWYRDGTPYSKDWYCARTVDGAPVAAEFEVDELLSQEGRLVLKSGAVVQQDHRARTNDVLDRPGEACR
jgi:hypothetical protein